MYKLIFIVLIISINISLYSQVGINTSTPNEKSALDITSTSKGFLPPRMTEAQRNEISIPIPAGLMLWCTDCGTSGQMQVYNGTIWTDFAGNPASPAPFICGTSTVTFTYKGSVVTYGTVLSADGRCWLDRNLGAERVAISFNDVDAYGDLFQWGREDDGHQTRTSDVTYTLATSNSPGHDDYIATTYFGSTPPHTWSSPQDFNLWQGVNGVNNVCPSGFRLPTESEWLTEYSSWTTTNLAGAFDSPLKLTVTRSRNDIGAISGGNIAYYWTSNVTNNETVRAFRMSTACDFTNGYVGFGLGVRCIKD